MEYNFQAAKKTIEWAKKNPDRNAQFEYINNKTKLFHKQNQPVISVDTKKVVNLISNTKTKQWLTIKARLDEKIYKTWIQVSDKELKKVNLMKYTFHGEWNYSIHP